MRIDGRKLAAWAVLAALLLPWTAAAAGDSQEESPGLQAKPAPAKPKVRTEDIVPGPKDIRERSAVIVFLFWMWFSIAVLLYVLRLKVREVDRLSSLEKPPAHPATKDGLSS